MEPRHVPAFGTLLRRARRTAALTQEALAERSGVSARTISDLERNVEHGTRADTVALLAEALALQGAEHVAFVTAARRLRSPGITGIARSGGTNDAGHRRQPPFVGRQRELALLERHLAGEGPPVLWLAGEPGIGKTRLLQTAIASAVLHGWQVLDGGCQRLGGQVPYTPLLEALQRYIRRQRTSDLRAQLRGCAWLVRVLPELADGPLPPLPSWTVSLEQERRLVAEAVRQFLSNIAGSSGTLLVLDDLQWAGRDTLDLLATVARAAAEIPLRILGAYRDTEIQAQYPLSNLQTDLAHAGLSECRVLAPLNVEESAALLDGLVPHSASASATVRSRVLERGGGVPFYLVSCAQELRVPAEASSRIDTVPKDVAQSVRQRVANLVAGASEVLGVAAVIGRVVPFPLLVAVTSQAEAAVLRGLDAACWGQLLEDVGGGAYQFAHDVIREVVEADLGTARRMVLHRRIAGSIERLSGAQRIEELAYHYARSDAPDQALPYLEQAGDRAVAQSAYGAAEAYYQELIDCLERLGRRDDAARASGKLGMHLERMGRFGDALVALQRAAESSGVSDPTTHAAPTYPSVGTEAKPDPARPSVAVPQSKIRRLEDDTPLRARIGLSLAHAALLMYQGQIQDCLAMAEHADELARSLGDHALRAQALLRRGNALQWAGRSDDALTALYEARRLCEVSSDVGLLGAVLKELVFAHELRGEFGQSARHNAQSLAIAEAIGDTWSAAMAVFRRGVLAFDTGDWENAQADLKRTVQLAPHLAQDDLTACMQAELSLARGAWEEASAQLGQILARAVGAGHAKAEVWAGRLLAQLDVVQQRPASAVARLYTALNRGQSLDRSALLSLLAQAKLQLGAVAAADDVASEAVAHATAEGNRLALVEALLARALVDGKQRKWRDAERTLNQGLAMARAMPYPYAQARLLHIFGELQVAQRAPELARERLDQALAIFERLGARKDLERTEQVLKWLS